MSDPARILVVDPEPDFRRTVVEALGRQGYEADALADARAALAALEADAAYDVLIGNLDMDGSAAFDRLGGPGEAAWRPPLIAVADRPAVATAVRALRLGALDYLAKPIKPADLGRAVAHAVDKSRAVGGVRQAQQAIQTWSRWFRFLEDLLWVPGAVRLPPSLLAAIAPPRSPRPGRAGTFPADALSAREREVLLALATGRRVRQIAQDFHISFHTARAHVRAILRKLHCHSQTELLTRLRDAGRPEGKGGRG